jgi:serine/threonine protein kinase
MELLQGEMVDRRLARGPLGVPALVDCGIALADALDAAHAAGIVHRDIKPANILLTGRGPKLLDFGVAKAVAGPFADSSTQTTMAAAPPLTAPGSAIGTFASMSPEQLRGEDVAGRSDLFSLGLVLISSPS